MILDHISWKTFTYTKTVIITAREFTFDTQPTMMVKTCDYWFIRNQRTWLFQWLQQDHHIWHRSLPWRLYYPSRSWKLEPLLFLAPLPMAAPNKNKFAMAKQQQQQQQKHIGGEKSMRYKSRRQTRLSGLQSSLRNTTSSYFSDKALYLGAITLHGPHLHTIYL